MRTFSRKTMSALTTASLLIAAIAPSFAHGQSIPLYDKSAKESVLTNGTSIDDIQQDIERIKHEIEVAKVTKYASVTIAITSTVVTAILGSRYLLREATLVPALANPYGIKPMLASSGLAIAGAYVWKINSLNYDVWLQRLDEKSALLKAQQEVLIRNK